METTAYFEKATKCQGSEDKMGVELGRSPYFEEDGIYLTVEGKSVVMDRKTAKEFVEAAISLGSVDKLESHPIRYRCESYE